MAVGPDVLDGPDTEAPGRWQLGGATGGWWDRERAELLAQRLAAPLQSARLVIDVGCGRGEMVRRWSADSPAFVVGCDYHPYDEWRPSAGKVAFVACDATALPFRNGVADLATSLDVIEHLPDDRPALDAVRAIVRPGGHVGVTVPALPQLWSPFDDVVGHQRRYRRAELDVACGAAGLDRVRTTYFFAWLVPPAWLLRRRDRSGADDSRPGVAGRLADAVVRLLCGAERRFLRRRDLAVGTSLLSVRRVPAGDVRG